MTKPVQVLDRVTIRFAGDSGDGMQLTGDRFTSETAAFGNDLSTLPDFPAEIRAPAGSIPGVSGFQLHFADHDILTPGDAPDVLVAMNPAALKANLGDLPKGASLIVNTDSFTARNLDKAGYAGNPLEDGTLADHQVHPVPLTSMTLEALKEFDISKKEAERAKNMFALGLMSWLYHRPTEATVAYLEKKFASRPVIAKANVTAFKAGWNYGETTEAFAVSYEIKPAKLTPGTYRNISGNLALAYGLVAASQLSGLPLFLGAYPITPASDILHELSKHKAFGVRTFQAEDEIAGVGAALGAAFGGALGVTTSSGPGIALKAETIGLGVSLELPLLVIDIQRSGPSTGMPTKTEQADLLQVLYGRNGEAPVPVVAPSLPDISTSFATEPNHEGDFWPYLRDETTLARPWAVPGTPGLEHRIGGLEKADGTGNISYDPDNHDRMINLRAAKVAGIAADIPPVEVDHQDGSGLLVLGWGSTYGPIGAAVRRVRATGARVSVAHLRHLNPFPANLGEVLAAYDQVLIPEMNLGQLRMLVRSRYLVDAVGYNKVRGLPFKAEELADAIIGLLDEGAGK
jgi:2-oxoglutarate ferredoxin oxidoreductase subunit alpha